MKKISNFVAKLTRSGFRIYNLLKFKNKFSLYKERTLWLSSMSDVHCYQNGKLVGELWRILNNLRYLMLLIGLKLLSK